MQTMSLSGDADVVTVGGDIADPSTAQRVVAAGMERFGRIDTASRMPGSSSQSINTPLNPEDVHEFLAGLEPVGHLGERSDVVDAVLYLENAPFVTGEIVDGGQSAGH
jgi:hypothetical protein